MEEVIGSKMQLLTQGSSWKRRPLGVDDGPQLATDATVWREAPSPKTALARHSTTFSLHFPDGDLALLAARSTQHIAVLGGAQGLDGVRVCHQLLLHRHLFHVHHKDFPSGSSLRQPPATHPDL